MVSLPTMNRLPTCFARQRSLCVNTGIGRCKTCFTRSNLKAELHRLPCVMPHLLTWSQSLPRRSAKAKATKFGAKISAQDDLHQLQKGLQKDNDDILRMLLDSSYDIDNLCRPGVTPLHLVAAYGKAGFAAAMFMHPASPVGGHAHEDNGKLATVLLSKGINKKNELQEETVLEQILSSWTEGTGYLSLSTQQLQAVLQQASDVYYNSGQPAIPDSFFDQLKDALQQRDPTAPFLSEVGAPVVRNRVTLPFGLYSLDKVKPGSKDVGKWQAKYPGPFCVSDKLDGTSCLIVYQLSGDKWQVKLMTRGDGVIGGDITHLIRYIIPGHLQHEPPAGFVGSTLAVRGEIIITKQGFASFAEVAGVASTARSLTNGLVNRKSVDPHVARKVDFVAHEVVSPRQDKASQMQLLSKASFKTVNCVFLDSLSDQTLAEQLDLRRRDSHYEIDGLVVESNGPHDHSDTGNPAFAFAFKKPVSEQGTQSKVIAVLWSPSKDGLLKPRVQYEPIQLEGVVMQFATAHNARYVLDNKIGPGAVVEVVRSGDVVPQILKVTTPATDAQMPDTPYTWSKTGVDAILEDPDKNQAVQIKRLVKFFSEMSISDISQGLITRFWDHGFQNLNSYLDASIDDFMQLPGAELSLATKLHTNIQTGIQSAPLVKLMKASNSFAGGIGGRKLEAIWTQLPDLLIMTGPRDDQLQALLNVDGVQKATAEKVLLGVQQFKQFLQNHPRIVVKDARAVPASAMGLPRLSEMTVVFYGVFSGAKDHKLAAKISELGGKVERALSSRTTVLVVKDARVVVHVRDFQAICSKIQEAQEMGIKVMHLPAFKNFVSQSC